MASSSHLGKDSSKGKDSDTQRRSPRASTRPLVCRHTTTVMRARSSTCAWQQACGAVAFVLSCGGYNLEIVYFLTGGKTGQLTTVVAARTSLLRSAICGGTLTIVMYPP